jgi:outer membrane lipoprotein-sorting protein
MWLKKPNQFRVECTRPDGERGGVLVADGDNLWIYWPGGRPMFGGEDPAEHEAVRAKSYYSHPTPLGGHSIGHEVAYLAADVHTVVDPSTFHGYTDSLQPYLDAVAGRGTESVADEPCDVIEVSYMTGQRTWDLWLSQRDHLPRRLREVVRVSNNVITDVRWTKVIVDGDAPATQFAWSPPTDWKQWYPPTAEQQLLTAGTPAPEFDAALADGKRIKLSDLKGKVVILAFWRVG